MQYLQSTLIWIISSGFCTVTNAKLISGLYFVLLSLAMLHAPYSVAFAGCDEACYGNPHFTTGEIEFCCERDKKSQASLEPCENKSTALDRVKCAVNLKAPSNRTVENEEYPAYPWVRVTRFPMECGKANEGGTKCRMSVTIEGNRGASGESNTDYVCQEISGTLSCTKE